MANSDKEKPQSSKVIPFSTVKSRYYNAEAERKDNVIGRKIAEARHRKGFSLMSFSRMLEDYGLKVGGSAIAKWERGETLMNPYQLVAVCRVLDIASIFSLCADYRPELNAVGQKKVDAYKADLLATGRYMPLSSVEENTVEYIEMPFSHLAVSAGLGEFLDEEQFEMESFPAASVPAGADFALRINGDSMEPVYNDKQIVWVEKTTDLHIGEVGIFIVDGEGLIKVLGEQDVDEEDEDEFSDSYGGLRKQPVLISYNKSYKPRVISASSQFTVVGRVLH
jgi:phage repressor protein C with HTH and peptisase S24 domain